MLGRRSDVPQRSREYQGRKHITETMCSLNSGFLHCHGMVTWGLSKIASGAGTRKRGKSQAIGKHSSATFSLVGTGLGKGCLDLFFSFAVLPVSFPWEPQSLTLYPSLSGLLMVDLSSFLPCLLHSPNYRLSLPLLFFYQPTILRIGLFFKILFSLSMSARPSFLFVSKNEIKYPQIPNAIMIHVIKLRLSVGQYEE